MHYLSEHAILIFLIQVSLLLGLSRWAGMLLQRHGQPAISGEILVGILLGPTLFGRVLPRLHEIVFPQNLLQQNMLETVAWLGILLFLLDAGLETNLTAALRQRRPAFTIAISDLIIPIVIAFIPACFLPEHFIGTGGDRVVFSLFIATIMTISALPVTARILQDLGIYRSDASLLTMCALTINDLVGWLVFAVILGFATGGPIDYAKIALMTAGTLLFATLSLTVGRKISDRFLGDFQRLNLPQPGTSLTFIFLIGMIGGTITLAIGIHALFGFFIIGIMAGESEHLSENTRQTISQLVRALLVPLFFATIGLKIDFLKELNIPLTLFMLLVGIAGRFIGAWTGVSLTKHPKTNRHLIAAAHTPGGEMQIVIGILAMEFNVITAPVFVSIVVSAVLSSIFVGPWMKWALKRGREASLFSTLTPATIISAFHAPTKEAAITALCKQAGEGLDLDQVIDLVLKRERLTGTALGDGVAIPHARLNHLATPRILLARTQTGIEWDAPDGLPVRFICLILTPEDDDRSQLQYMRTIALTLRNQETRKALLDAPAKRFGGLLLSSMKSAVQAS